MSAMVSVHPRATGAISESEEIIASWCRSTNDVVLGKYYPTNKYHRCSDALKTSTARKMSLDFSIPNQVTMSMENKIVVILGSHNISSSAVSPATDDLFH
jgi:hypothetical protein